MIIVDLEYMINNHNSDDGSETHVCDFDNF